MKKKLLLLIPFFLGLFILFVRMVSLSMQTWAETSVTDFSDSALNDIIVTNESGGELRLPHPMAKTVADYTDNSLPRFAVYDSSGAFYRAQVIIEDVFLLKYSAGGDEIANVRVNDVAGAVRGEHARVAVSKDGIAIVVWHQINAADDSVFLHYQMFDREMNKSGDIGIIARFRFNGGPFAVFDNTGEGNFWIIHRPEDFGSGEGFYVRRVDYQGQKGEPLFRFASLSSVAHNMSPAVAVAPNHDLMMAWTASAGETSDYSDIYVQRFTPHGEPISAAVKVNDDSRLITQSNADICFDDQQNFLVVWCDWRDNVNEATPYDLNIYGQLFDSDGNKVGANFRVNTPQQYDDDNPDAFFRDGEFVVSWGPLIRRAVMSNVWVTAFAYRPVTSGTAISSIFDTGGSAQYHAILWQGITPQVSSIAFQIRTAGSRAGIELADFYGPTNNSDFYANSPHALNPIHNGDRFIQYKAVLQTEMVGLSPVLNSVSITFSPADSTAPAAPTELAALAGHSAVTLTWKPAPDSDLAQHRLYRGTQSGVYDQTWTQELPASATGFIDTTAVSCTRYLYALSSVDSSHNESSLAPEVHATPFGEYIYVNSTSAGGDGSAINPFAAINEAIEHAVYGDTILVLPGTYNEMIKMKKGVSLVGSGAEATIIEGPTTAIYHTILGADETVLRGFMIINNNLPAGACVRCSSTSMTITENILIARRAGVAMENSKSIIEGNYFLCNELGIEIQHFSSPIIKNTIIDSDLALFVANNSNPTIINNVLLIKNIGIRLVYSSNCEILNTIFVGKKGDEMGIRSLDCHANISYSNFWNIGDKYSGHDLVVKIGEGIIEAEPNFVSLAKGDYRLRPESPCVNAGHPAAEYQDSDGSRNDMGAFGGPTPIHPELTQRPGKSISIASVSGFPGESVNTFIILDNPAGVARVDARISYTRTLLTPTQVALTSTTQGFDLEQDFSTHETIKISMHRATEIDGGDGAILKLGFAVNEYAASGQASPLEIENVHYFDAAGNEIRINSITNGAFIVNAGSENGRYVYVDNKKDDNGDGSRNRPYLKIQEAIDNAAEGDTIVVASGVYAERPLIRKEVYLRGAGAMATSIVAEPDHDIVIFSGVSKGEISGFTIKPLRDEFAMSVAIVCTESSPVIRHNRIEYYEGSIGIDCFRDSKPLIEENALINCGITVSSAQPIIRNNSIQPFETAGVESYDASFPLIEGNIIYSGLLGIGPAVSIINSSASVKNNLLLCISSSGGIWMHDAADVEVKNNIIADSGVEGTGFEIFNSSGINIINNTVYTRKRGVFEQGSDVVVMNSIFTGNQEYGLSLSSDSQSLFNNVWGNNLNYFNCDPGNNDISADPLFSSQAAQNFSLAPGSPCINAGNPAAEYNDPDGSRNDMGAFGGPDAFSNWSTQGARLALPAANAACQDTIRLAITGSDIKGIAGVELILSYDEKMLTFLNASTAKNTTGFSLTYSKLSPNAAKIIMSATSGLKDNDGDIATLAFVVNAASDAKTMIRFSHATIQDQVATNRPIKELVNGSIDITETAVDVNGDALSFQLHQNYPNPFNGATVIKYQIPSNGHVSLRIFDIMGRETRELVDGRQAAGAHQITWDGNNDLGFKAASGVYFYQINAGEFRQIRKLLLIK